MEADPGSLTLKRLCETRWSSRVDAVHAVRDRYPHIIKILTRLAMAEGQITSQNSVCDFCDFGIT